MKEFNEIKKDSGFKVPDNYFNVFASKMEEMVKEESAVTKKQFSIKPILSMAAVFISVLAISWVLFANLSTPEEAITYDTLAYLECNIDDFSDDLLYESSADIITEEFSDDFLDEIDYLEEEISDDELINNLEY